MAAAKAFPHRPALLLAAALWALPAPAAAWTPPADPAGWGRFALGFVGGVAGHELGHVLVATAQGDRVAFSGPSIVYPDAETGGAGQFHAASAGFQAQWLLSEAVLWHHEAQPAGHRISNVGAGVVGAHLAITAAYLAVLRHHELSDIQGMANGSHLHPDQLMAVVTLPALLDGWRLFAARPPGWVPRLARLGKGIGIAMVWRY
ncbi:MAG: hypothetical protein HZA24_04955 [Nitrospirae bacterium]|nr:hypothetical protein [Nitrospirota bacterium]